MMKKSYVSFITSYLNGKNENCLAGLHYDFQVSDVTSQLNMLNLLVLLKYHHNLEAGSLSP